MARGVNKVTLIGNLGADPEVRYTANGRAVANARVATAESWRDRETGDQQERTEWHNIVFFGKLAEIVEQYVKKGQQVYVEGRLQTRKWQDRDGNDRYTTEIVANEMQMLGGRGGGGGGDYSRDSGGAAEREPSSGRAAASSGAPGSNDFDDDIPF